MKINQQKQIKTYSIEKFGEEQGTKIFLKQEAMLDSLNQNTKDKTKNQMNTLTQTILPRIAMYKVLLAENISDHVTHGKLKNLVFQELKP